MSDLPEFLLARIAEDEAAAQSATPGPWEWRGSPGDQEGPELISAVGSEPVLRPWGYDPFGLFIESEDATHIARWDPARVLAECAAKRAIVELHDEPGHECIDRSGGVAIYPASDSMTIRDVAVPGCATLRLLAQPYAEHPDYRPEWRP